MSAAQGMQLPPPGELVQFTTKAQGTVVGAYFHGLFYCATSNDCWSAEHVTSWNRVLVVPDTPESRRALRLGLYEAGWQPPYHGARVGDYAAELAADRAAGLAAIRAADEEANDRNRDAAWLAVRAASQSGSTSDSGASNEVAKPEPGAEGTG